MRVVINGIGVAGPALAYWLTRFGHEVALVEQAHALGYQVREVRIVDRDGRKTGGFDVDVFARVTHDRFTSVRRSDISATIYRAIEGKVETIFGDSVATIDDAGDRVRVGFDHAPARDVDLVIGADGLHSRVRRIAFGAESEFAVPLGYHVAAFEASGYRPREELVYVSHSLPGRQISRFSLRDDRTMFLFIFRDERMTSDADPKTILRRVFAGAGWEWPQIEAEMERASEIYFDTVSQIHMQHWTKGRIALIGDAAACVSLMGGEGTGLAIAEAYVLATELNACGGDHATAYARYEERLMPFLAKKQELATKFASSFAPKTSFQIAFRNQMTKLMRVPFLADLAVGRAFRDDIALP